MLSFLERQQRQHTQAASNVQAGADVVEAEGSKDTDEPETFVVGLEADIKVSTERKLPASCKRIEED